MGNHSLCSQILVMNPFDNNWPEFGTKEFSIHYEKWAAFNRQLCGCRNERGGVETDYRPRIRHDSQDTDFWRQRGETLKMLDNMAKTAHKPRQVQETYLTPMADQVHRGSKLVED